LDPRLLYAEMDTVTMKLMNAFFFYFIVYPPIIESHHNKPLYLYFKNIKILRRYRLRECEKANDISRSVFEGLYTVVWNNKEGMVE
jgi:hypothetical protein